MTCCSRLSSVYIERGKAGSSSMAKSSFLSCAICAERPVHVIAQRRERCLADVERDGAGLDLRQIQDVVDQAEQIGARVMDGAGRTRPACRSDCPGCFRTSSFDRINRLFSGVRSSWLILARNSDLYFDVSASCSALSSSSRLACSTSRFLASTCLFCIDSSCAFSSSSTFGLLQFVLLGAQQFFGLPECRGLLFEPVVGLLQLLLLRLKFGGQQLRLREQASVRMLAAIVLSTMPIDSMSWFQQRLVGSRRTGRSRPARSRPSRRLRTGRAARSRSAAGPCRGPSRSGRNPAAHWTKGFADLSMAHWPIRPSGWRYLFARMLAVVEA